MVNIRVSRATQKKLKKLKKGNMTYDDVISSAVSGENWDVKKIDADYDEAIKNTGSVEILFTKCTGFF